MSVYLVALINLTFAGIISGNSTVRMGYFSVPIILLI